ncbi:hypothetical protein EMIT0P265_160012 [Pseudomonas zeae]
MPYASYGQTLDVVITSTLDCFNAFGLNPPWVIDVET